MPVTQHDLYSASLSDIFRQREAICIDVHVTVVNANRRDMEGRFDVIACIYADSVDHGLERRCAWGVLH